MSFNKNNPPVNLSNEQEKIDLIDVLLQIWRGKWLVALFVVSGIVLAAAYLSVAKEKWTSVAVISSPDGGQIAGYANAMSVIINDPESDISDIPLQVITRFNASFSALAETLKNQEKPEDLEISSSVQGQPLPLKLSYVGQTPEEAQQKLAQYIQQIDQKITKELIDDLKNNIRAQTKNLMESLTSQEKIAQEQKDLRIRQIVQALTVAKEAGVQSPQVQQTDAMEQDNLFLLGSAALESMIKNESSRPLVFSDDYFKTRQNLLDLQAISVDPKTVHAYRYVMKPSLPVFRDSPKKALTLVLAMMLGAVIGAGIVLARNAIRAYLART